MADIGNIGIYDIDTDGEYVKFSEITDVVFEVGVVYTIQAQTYLPVYLVAKGVVPDPNEGFKLLDTHVMNYTHEEGKDLWVKTTKPLIGKTYINIAM